MNVAQPIYENPQPLRSSISAFSVERCSRLAEISPHAAD
jgi:hypothetical protein